MRLAPDRLPDHDMEGAGQIMIGEWTILLIEDNPDDQVLIKEASTEFARATTIVIAETLEDGIRICLQLMPSLVLLDLHLSDSTGYATAQQFMGECRRTPLIVMTGDTNPEIGLQAIRDGAQDFMIKGVFCPAELEARIAFSIERFSLLNDPDMLLGFMRRLLGKSSGDRDGIGGANEGDFTL
jgi:CheY-like chemotaxis protein